jgi:crotonobetainyl-CoA:carnitine CoA-transferase CaiB-like acyl-CoA transferase
MTGLYAAFALVSGVVSARATGTGRDIDVSLFDAALQNLTYLAVWYLNAGINQQRAPRSSHPSLTPSQLYKTKDGFIFIMCNKEKFWPVLCDAIGRPEWRDREDYKDFKARLANRDRLTVELDAALSTRTTAEWIERFAGSVPAAPVHDVKAALDNAFVRDEGRVRAAGRGEGAVHMLAPPVRCPGEDMPCEPAPALGADTDDILGRLGFAPHELARLRAAGAL